MNIKYITIYMGAILLIGCQDKKYAKVLYDNGKVKAKIELDKNNMPNGEHLEYYESGKLKLRSRSSNGRLVDTLFIYDEEGGYLKEKGLLVNGFRNSWWSSFDENENKISDIEYIIKNEDTLFENQKKNFNKDGSINYNESSFFNIHIPDTLSLGVNWCKGEYFTNFPKEDRFRYVVIDNIHPSKGFIKDTFYFDDSDFKFVFLGSSVGKLKVKGRIVEEVFLEEIKNKDTILRYVTFRKHFENEVYVKDSIPSPLVLD